MQRPLVTSAVVLGLVMGVITTPIYAQGQGKGSGKGRDKSDKAEHAQSRGSGQDKSKRSPHARSDNGAPGNGKGRSVAPGQSNKQSPGAAASQKGNANRDNALFARGLKMNEVKPSMRRFIESHKNSERFVAGAVAHAYARGLSERDFIITPNGKQVFVRNRKGDVLLDLDDDRARKMGNWRVNILDDRIADGAPSFCRSGAGHPVWGRQWCFDKRFGLGGARNFRWGVTDEWDQTIVWRPMRVGSTIAADLLTRVLGAEAMDRLALHAITLGLVDPLMGRWLGEPNGQRVLLVQSGSTPLAEFIDYNRDDHVDRSLISLLPW